MPDEVDFFRILTVVGAEPALFAAARDAARKAVNDIVRLRLALDDTDLGAVRRIRALLDAPAFAEAVDGLPAAKVKALVTRLDPYAAGLSTAPDRIRHLLALAAGTVAPATAPEKKAAGKKPAATRGKKGAVVPAADAAAPATPAAGEPTPKTRRRLTGRTALRVSEER